MTVINEVSVKKFVDGFVFSSLKMKDLTISNDFCKYLKMNYTTEKPINWEDVIKKNISEGQIFVDQYME